MSKLREFQDLHQTHPAAANRRLLEWLSNDASRADLYRCLSEEKHALCFESPADVKEMPNDPGDSSYKQTVYLLAEKDQIERAFKQLDEFSNSPFRALGGGGFMLAQDDGPSHTAQRQFAKTQLRIDNAELMALVTVAFQAGALLSLKQRKFDLAELAEQVAVRYMGLMFGFAQSDQALIEATMHRAYRGLCYQVMGRHFVSEPGIMPEATAGMGALLRRAAELIGLYQGDIGRERLRNVVCSRCGRRGHDDGINCAQADEMDLLDRELAELREFALPSSPGQKDLRSFQPLLRRMAASDAGLTATQGASMVVGLVAGAIGNMQASICIAMQHFFNLTDQQEFARLEKMAQEARVAARGGAGADVALTACVEEALRRNPPVAFLPRKTLKDVYFGAKDGPPDIPMGHVVLLGIGGATRRADDTGPGVLPPASNAEGRPHGAPSLIFGGGADDASYLHSCVGQHLAMPLVVHVVRQMLVLPGLAEACDPRTGRPRGLRKQWGYGCESYPLEFQREAVLLQSPLTVIMKIKTPTSEHAEKLKLVIKYGAPSIEKKLREAKHVHFAYFQFLENDTKLALYTVFDRDFDAYIAHFALEIGSLFDKIFEHIVDGPPLPVDEFPREFVETIRRYNVAPAAGYFFSAYPTADAASLIDAQARASK